MTNNSELTLSNVSCWDKTKQNTTTSTTTSIISTGVGFFDHMLDQLNSHAQIGVSVTVVSPTHNDEQDKNRHAHANQEALMTLVGRALGEQLHPLVHTSTNGSTKKQSRFCCPLDEALVECILTTSSTCGSLECYSLAPYGIYPKSTGRTIIGSMQTQPLEQFFTALAQSMKVNVSLKKQRGKNGHHIVESCFKAFSRALRCWIDGVAAGDVPRDVISKWGTVQSQSQSDMQLRSAAIERKTKETSIAVKLALDGDTTEKKIHVDTGLPTMDVLLVAMVEECPSMSLDVTCRGDVWIDDHHTSEDVSIAIGQALNEALGTKAGLNRMWTSSSTHKDAHAEIVMDLSNRPCLCHDFEQSSFCTGSSQTLSPTDTPSTSPSTPMSIEMMEHVLDSLVMNARMTVHLVTRSDNTTSASVEPFDVAMATMKAFGKALYLCTAVDPRRAGKTASSKGTLSA